jgi:rubrerythrin
MIDKKKPKLDDDYGEIENVSPSTSKKVVKCKYCNFQFNANFETKTPKSCPYCGRAFFVEI